MVFGSCSLIDFPAVALVPNNAMAIARTPLGQPDWTTANPMAGTLKLGVRATTMGVAVEETVS